ncbi:MAG: hypothetical protein DGJ47_000482 [Rickettsiaceae bacterium]
MYNLFHHQLCPLSKQIRVLLDEIKTDYNLKKEDYWLRRPEFIKMNQAGTLPILQTDSNENIIGYYAIIEFLSESSDNFFLMPKDPLSRANVRRYISWFNDKFYREVSKIIVDEKMIRPITQSGEPRGEYIRLAKNNLLHHFNLIEKTLDDSAYLSSETITCADIAAASHIAIIDYFGEIYWDRWPAIKHWYSIIKSRPSFRMILSDRIPGLNPPSHYSDPDF